MLIIALFLGILCGIITGLVPGIHVNLISLIIVSLPLSKILSPLSIGVFLISLVIVHSFLDFIPSIFLGAPEAATALSILPGHDFLMKGRGYYALKLTTIGGLGAAIICIPITICLFFSLEKIYSLLSFLIAPIILLISIALILIEDNKIWSIVIFLLSGILGLIVLNNINITQPLFPLLSGLFGIPILIISILNKSRVKKQRIEENIQVFTKSRFLNYLKAGLSSLIVSILPAVGSAQATIIANCISRENKEDFLITIGGINTAGGLLTLSVFYILGKARTGVMSSLQQIIVLNFQQYLILFVSGLIAMGFGIILTLKIGKLMAKKISNLNYTKISLSIILIISVFVFLFTGLIGLFILSIATGIGVLSPIIGTKRIHAMGCLVIPILVYFI